IEDNEVERQSIISLLSKEGVQITAAGTAEDGMQALRARRFDCLVLDLRLPDMSGLALLEKVEAEAGLRELPGIVYTGKDLATEEEPKLKALSRMIIAKYARSMERLLQETDTFLTRVETGQPGSTAERRPTGRPPRQVDSLLEGKKVLIVDDDVRNVFAL